MDSITIEHCNQWLSRPNVNPLTKRRIATYGPVYEMFRKRCAAYGLENKRKPLCEAKWIAFDSNEADLYEKSLIKTCKHCKQFVSYSVLHFIHARDDASVADYECARCKESGNLAYFCLRCRNADDEEED